MAERRKSLRKLAGNRLTSALLLGPFHTAENLQLTLTIDFSVTIAFEQKDAKYNRKLFLE